MARADQDLDSARAELYRLPREDFTAARNELAKRLGREGDRAAADTVKALRKPSAAAWVVNQLSHEAKRDMTRLFKAGDRMVEASDAAALRKAAGAEREAIAALLARAEEIADGLPAATSERVRETLHAAAGDAAVRDQVERGCLEKEQQLVGFGAAAVGGGRGASKASGKAATPKGDRQSAERGRDERRRQRDHEGAQRDLERAERAHARAMEQAQEAQAELERAQAELEQAQERERALASD